MLGSIQWAVRQSSEAENYLTSVERIFEYANLVPEPEVAVGEDNDKPEQSDKPKDAYQFRMRIGYILLSHIKFI